MSGKHVQMLVVIAVWRGYLLTLSQLCTLSIPSSQALVALGVLLEPVCRNRAGTSTTGVAGWVNGGVHCAAVDVCVSCHVSLNF